MPKASADAKEEGGEISSESPRESPIAACVPSLASVRDLRFSRALTFLCIMALWSTLWVLNSPLRFISRNTHNGLLLPDTNSTTCPQWDALYPIGNAHIDAELEAIYASTDFKLRAIDLLAGAIRIPTESHDNSGPVGEDPAWNIFADFHEYLERVFPLVYTKLNVTKINTYGLVYHWQGSTEVKPILLTAHQDVVPVDPTTVSQWIHPPYSGHYDGTWIWGRGTCDDKSEIIERLIVVDSLLRRGFTPTRTLVIALGFDEEVAGVQGASHIAKYLEETYGHDGFAMLVDEGPNGLVNFGDGFYFVSPKVSEKGYFDVRVEVASPGGHSSIPPAHTSIGLLSLAISAIEANPHSPELPRNGTHFSTIQCLADYSPSFPEELRNLAHRAVSDDRALVRLEDALSELSPAMRAMMVTTQAVNVIKGGVKANALPERASAVVNHRIAEHSSVAKLQQHLIDVLSPVAASHELTLRAFGRVMKTGDSGEIIISNNSGIALEPSPVTPVGYGPYSILTGTIKATITTSKLYNDTPIILGPSLSLANTDTVWYWNLTKHIFRSSLVTESDYYNGVHTVNEALRADAYIEGIRFLTKLILNVDESPLS
ncbi:hypothetical protein BKA82DRAFT_997879 [Pisolithus tinctorius]|uniref:Peptidase M20 dimerisation domain-containing protein n=1 Tax=Pisolithus tinctorius Marx 270 TaxID=870435 RepID=A0A0C3PI49_PISTI|nr:hypothetical protein BKA82DRAFT_997879 [Pisolithus tinctorius]KIO07734.1 hypothetical protein M404DRAFT_997879 [Pisolithus tinctorius Marx 270]